MSSVCLCYAVVINFKGKENKMNMSQGKFDVADMKTNLTWRFRWEYRNNEGGYAPHCNFHVWNGVCGRWTSVYGSFDLNEGVAYIEHMDKSELSAHLVEQALRFGE